MKNYASCKVIYSSKAKSVGLALVLLISSSPSMGEVTTSKVQIPVVGSKCNDRVKEVSTVPGLLRLPSKSTGQVPAVVLLHSNAGIVGVGDFYARALNSAGIATLEVDSFLPRVFAVETNGLRRFYVTDFKMPGERWFSCRQTPGSTHNKLELQDFQVVPLLPSWLAWESDLPVWRKTIRYCRENRFMLRTLRSIPLAPISWMTISVFVHGSIQVDHRTGAPRVNLFISCRVPMTILISIQRRIVCECVMSFRILPVS